MTKSTIKNCKGVFFDLYGTLLDYNEEEIANKNWLNSLYEMVGIPNGISFEIVKSRAMKILEDDWEMNPDDSLTIYETKIQNQFAQEGISFSRDQLAMIANESVGSWQATITLAENAIQVMQQLSQTKKLALISNFDHTPHVKKVVSKHQLDLYLNPIIISDEVKCKKPDPRIFQLALEQTNLSAEEVIFVGDSYTDDVLGARSANIHPVMIKHKSNSHRHNNNHSEPNLTTIQSLSELLELLS